MFTTEILCKKIHSDAILPVISENGEMTLYTYADFTIPSKQVRIKIPTGIAIGIPKDYYPRVLIETKLLLNGITLLGGFMDTDRTLSVIVYNCSDIDYTLRKEDFACKIVFHKIHPVTVKEYTGDLDKITIKSHVDKISGIFSQIFGPIEGAEEKLEITELKKIEPQKQIAADDSSLNALEEYRKSKQKTIKEKAIQYEEDALKIADDFKSGNYIKGVSGFVKTVMTTSKDKDFDLIQKEVVKNLYNLKEKTELEDVIEENNGVNENPDTIKEIE
jgi:dUTPase